MLMENWCPPPWQTTSQKTITYMELVSDKVVLQYLCLRTHRFSPASIILPLFQSHFVPQQVMASLSKTLFFLILSCLICLCWSTLEKETITFSQMVGYQSPSEAAPYLGTKTSTTPLRTPKVIHRNRKLNVDIYLSVGLYLDKFFSSHRAL
jgi:hypothetical protein